eukprot:gene12321-biopygen3880
MSDVRPVERRRSCEAREVLWSAAENVEYVDCVQCHGVRGVPRSAAECRGVRGVPRSARSAAECRGVRGVPRSAAECAECRGVPRSAAECRGVPRSALRYSTALHAPTCSAGIAKPTPNAPKATPNVPKAAASAAGSCQTN